MKAFRHSITLASIVLVLFAPLLGAAYRALEAPLKFRIDVATPAYDPANPSEKLGDFREGLEVHFVEERFEEGFWLVAFKRFGKPDVNALIPIPDLSQVQHERFLREAKETIAQFPALQRLFEANHPWPGSTADQAQLVFGKNIFKDGKPLSRSEMMSQIRGMLPDTDSNERLKSVPANKRSIVSVDRKDLLEPAWGISPALVSIDRSDPASPRIVYEFWNKGDAPVVYNFEKGTIEQEGVGDASQARNELRKKLSELEKFFRTKPVARDVSTDTGITALKTRGEMYYLPNDLVANLRYKRGEYLILELSSFRAGIGGGVTYDPDTFSATLKTHVKKTKEGHLFVDGIPMIDQGSKGYCAAATVARVLRYYGYPVDMHACAELADTTAGGTSGEDLIASVKRICNSTPFKMETIKFKTREVAVEEIEDTVNQGIPIIWLVEAGPLKRGYPNHLRLLNGLAANGEGVVYSDSYGPGHEAKVMDWNEFRASHFEMWKLVPQR